jgi:hypothetical protein
LHSLRLKLKNETKAIRKCREEGVRTITISKRLSVPSLTPSAQAQEEKPLGVTISKTLTKKLDISERLNLAKQEAILERKMDQLKDDLLRQSKQETVDKTMKFLQKLPGITNGNEQEQGGTGLRRSSSIPSMLRQSSGMGHGEEDPLVGRAVVS